MCWRVLLEAISVLFLEPGVFSFNVYFMYIPPFSLSPFLLLFLVCVWGGGILCVWCCIRARVCLEMSFPSKGRFFCFVCLLFFLHLESFLLHYTNRVHLLFLWSDSHRRQFSVWFFFFSILILADLYLFFFFLKFINNVLLIIKKKRRRRSRTSALIACSGVQFMCMCWLVWSACLECGHAVRPC